MNVLVLDDSEVDRQTITRLCDKAGLNCSISEAANLEEFSQALDATSLDLVFIDYMLGAHTGIDALNALLKHSNQAAAASIMIAGEGQIEIAVEAMRMGCADYLTKSMLTVDSLQKSIATAVERKAVMAQLSEDAQTRRALEANVRRYAETSSAEMRNLLSATLRRVRLMRRHKAGPDYVRDLSTLELDIDRLWEALPKFKTQVTKELSAESRPKALH
ncbi:MAG: response regulator, partial [Paracoccaceae bacterium]